MSSMESKTNFSTIYMTISTTITNREFRRSITNQGHISNKVHSKFYAYPLHSQCKFGNSHPSRTKSGQLHQRSTLEAKIHIATKERSRRLPSLISYPNPTGDGHGKSIHSSLLLIRFLHDTFSTVHPNWPGDFLVRPVC